MEIVWTALVGPDLEIVLDDGHLTVQGEAEVRVSLSPGDHIVHQVDQPQAKSLKRLVPLAIPVSVRDQEDVGAHEVATDRQQFRGVVRMYGEGNMTCSVSGSGSTVKLLPVGVGSRAARGDPALASTDLCEGRRPFSLSARE